MENRDQILQMLGSRQEEERLQGLKALGRSAGEIDLSPVLGALGDESWRVRKEAVQLFLSTPGAGGLAGEVIELLHAHDNAGLRNAAVEILVRLGAPAVPLLLEELSCSDHDVRKFVLDILGEIGEESCVQQMILALADRDENVRAAAAENLGKIGATEAVPSLLDAIDRGDLWMRFTILEALARIGQPLPVDKLFDLAGERLLRKALFDCLGQIGSVEALPLLVNGLTDEMRNVREAAIVALERLAARFPEKIDESLRSLTGAPASAAVAAALESSDQATSRSAVRLLRTIGDSRFARPLLSLFDNDLLRDEAAAALVAMGPSAACSLIELWPGADGRTRAYLAYVFGESRCTEGLGLLLQALSDSDPELRLISAQALGKFREVDAIGPLTAVLRDPDDEIRESATQALGRLAADFPAETMRQLSPLFEEDDPELRMRVVSVFGRIGGPEVRSRLSFAMKDESPLVRRAAVRAIEGTAGEAELPSLMLALTDEDAEVRRLAAESLGGTRDRQAIAPLELALEDEDLWVRAAAVRSLGGLGAAEVLSPIRRALRDPVGLVAIAALESLAALDSVDTYPAVVESLGHDDEEVVNTALGLLEESGRADWVEQAAASLLNHRHWEVRRTFVGILARAEGPRCRSMLEERLLIEGEELVRQLIQDVLAQLPDHRG